MPEPLRDPHLGLDELVGAAEVAAITNAGLMQFQATGDTGVGLNSSQPVVAQAMAKEINTAKPASGPSFFLNLGDVIYGNGKQALYANNFYRPNAPYLHPAPGFEGVIVAIPGNHDCEARDPIDAPSLSAFQTNFVAPLGQQAPMATKYPSRGRRSKWDDVRYVSSILQDARTCGNAIYIGEIRRVNRRAARFGWPMARAGWSQAELSPRALWRPREYEFHIQELKSELRDRYGEPRPRRRPPRPR